MTGTPEGLGKTIELTISEGVSAIENLALYKCSTGEPANNEVVVTEEAWYNAEAENNNEEVQNYTNNVVSGDGQAPGNNETLETVSLPESLKQIRNSFVNCVNLKSIGIKGDPEVIYNSFRSCGIETLSVEKLSGEVGYSFCELDSLTSLTFGEIQRPDIKNTSLTSLPALESLEFTGKVDLAVPAAEEKNIGLFQDKNALTGVVFHGEVVSLPESFCKFCENLTSVIFEKSVGVIGRSCFESCSNLTDLKFEDKVDTICDFCFTGGKMTELTFGGDVGRIGKGTDSFSSFTFNNNDELKKVVFNGNVEELNNSFESCDNIESVDFGGFAGRIYGSFNECKSLKTVDFNGDVVTVEESFNKCDSLKTVDFKGDVDTLCDSFADSEKLETVTFGGKLNLMDCRLQSYLFKSSADVKLVNMPDGVKYGDEILSQRFDPAQQKFRAYYDLVNKYGGNLESLSYQEAPAYNLTEWMLKHVAGKTLAADKQIEISKAKSYAKDLNGPIVGNLYIPDCAYDDYGPEAAKKTGYTVCKIERIKSSHPETVFTEEKALKVVNGEAPLVIAVAESMGYIPEEYTAVDGSGYKETLYHEVMRVSLWKVETGELIAWYKYTNGDAPDTYKSNETYDYASGHHVGDDAHDLLFLKGKYEDVFDFLWKTIFPE
ncbi:MAG: leucine-rich repeat domain-containing protein [Clostridia bacterium]|nr:leucine-rich repeat domain-containing protein [Clostridia bacterium]